MKMFANLTIGKKIVGQASALIALLILLGGVVLLNLSSIDRALATITDDAMPGVQYIGGISSNIYQLRGDHWEHIASDSAGARETERAMAAVNLLLDAAMKKYEAAITQTDDRANFTRLVRPSARTTVAMRPIGGATSVPGAVAVSSQTPHDDFPEAPILQAFLAAIAIVVSPVGPRMLLVRIA
jgi:hypothetical protein